MTKAEEKAIKEFADYTAMLEPMTQQEANDFIAKTYMKTEIKKTFMAAYIKKFATSAADAAWVKKDFKKASFKKTVRKVKTVCTDANGVAIHKLNKDGKVIVQTAMVERVDSATYDKYDLNGAREAFLDHFGISTKENAFTPKAKRTEPKFDPFADIFG